MQLVIGLWAKDLQLLPEFKGCLFPMSSKDQEQHLLVMYFRRLQRLLFFTTCRCPTSRYLQNNLTVAIVRSSWLLSGLLPVCLCGPYYWATYSCSCMREALWCSITCLSLATNRLRGFRFLPLLGTNTSLRWISHGGIHYVPGTDVHILSRCGRHLIVGSYFCWLLRRGHLCRPVPQ